MRIFRTDKKADLRDQIKEERIMKKVISVILAGVMMAGLCACGKTGSVKETQENAKETTKETVESDTEAEAGGGNQAAPSEPNLFVIEGFSDQELFDLCRETMNITIVDGESVESLMNKLPGTRFGSTPYKWSYQMVGVTFEYSISLDGKDYDRMDEVILPFIYDDDTETFKNAGTDSNVVREGAVVMWFYSGRGQSVYDFFKSKYMEMYPDARIDDYSSEEYDQYNIYGQNNEVIRIRIDHYDSCKKVSVHECVFRK